MFFDSRCNLYNMWLDGVDEEYRRLGISKAQEAEWCQEYVSFWASQLSVDDLTAVWWLSGFDAALPDLLKMARKGDSYAQLFYANAIWETINSYTISAPMRELAIRIAMEIWQSLVQHPIEISDKHRAEIVPGMKVLGASNPEQYVRKYAKMKLTEAKKRLR